MASTRHDCEMVKRVVATAYGLWGPRVIVDAPADALTCAAFTAPVGFDIPPAGAGRQWGA